MKKRYFYSITPGHKYYLPFNTENRNPNEVLKHASYEDFSFQWVSAEDLKVGDKVLLSNGKYGIIIKTENKVLDEPKTIYNFEVADFHTYYVSKNGILVHNNGCEVFNFDSQANLENHFIQHNKDFNYMFNNSSEYLDAANYVIKNGTYIKELN